MAYDKIDYTKPDAVNQDGAGMAGSMRSNQRALADAVVMGNVPDWDMSVTGGTPDQPTEITYTYLTDTQKKFRATTVWNVDDNPETITYHASDDGGANWDLIGTKTITWSAGGAVLSIVWS